MTKKNPDYFVVTFSCDSGQAEEFFISLRDYFQNNPTIMSYELSLVHDGDNEKVKISNEHGMYPFEILEILERESQRYGGTISSESE